MRLKHYLIIFGLFFLDQLSKFFASTHLSFYDAFVIIPSAFSFQLVHNYGAAYGIFQNQRLFLTLVGLVVVVGSIIFQKMIIQSKLSKYGLVFLLGGALGNLVDRIRLGYVVDFIDIRIFPVFNFADIFIDIAIGLFVLELVYGFKNKKDA